jgi:hypothetical protein
LSDNELETDAEYRVEVDESLASSAILRTHGYRVVELNYQRNKIVEEQRRAWREHNERNAVQSATAMFTHCEEYFDLLEMGPSIIGPIMMDYQGRKFNPYWELLHEIVHGHKMGAHAIFVEPLFETWLQWFNYGDHKHVFKYEPTEADRAIYGLNTLEDYEHL